MKTQLGRTTTVESISARARLNVADTSGLVAGLNGRQQQQQQLSYPLACIQRLREQQRVVSRNQVVVQEVHYCAGVRTSSLRCRGRWWCSDGCVAAAAASCVTLAVLGRAPNLRLQWLLRWTVDH